MAKNKLLHSITSEQQLVTLMEEGGNRGDVSQIDGWKAELEAVSPENIRQQL